MQEISPEQKAHLETWAGQRDLLLSEISGLQTQKEKLTADVNNLSKSYSDLEARSNRISGKIEELNKREKEMPEIMLKEVFVLEKRKSVLEEQVSGYEKEIKMLVSQKESLEHDVSLAIVNFNILKDEALVLDKIVDHVTVVSEHNKNRIDALVAELAKSLDEIVAVNKKNVFETNVVIEKLPVMLMEAQKHGLIKPRNNVIRVK
jgi:chromosome segregation ATPase